MKIEITDIIDGVGAHGEGTTVVLILDVLGNGHETDVRYEAWHAGPADGEDFYVGDTDQPWSLEHYGELADTWEQVEDLLREYLSEVLEAYFTQWASIVNPAIELATTKSIVAASALLEGNEYEALR